MQSGDEFLEAMRVGAIVDRDPRWAKLALEHSVGKPVEVRDRGGDKSPLMDLFMEWLNRGTTIEGMDPDSYTVDGEARDVTEG